MRKQLLVTSSALVLVVAAAIAAWAALRTRDRPEWTTDSPAALAEMRRGLAAEQKFYAPEARKHFARALELDPEFATARLMLLRWSSKSPQRKTLLADLEAADRSRLSPREAFLVQYQIEFSHERYAQARELLEKYLAEHPRDPYALDLKINWLWDDQQWPQAESACKQLLAIDPNWVTAQNKLGYLSMSQGRFAEAEDRFRTYLYVAPDQANPHDSLGELLLLLGRFDDARNELEAAIAVRPDFCASYYHLAQLEVIARDVAASRAAIERARRVPACAGSELERFDCSQGLWEIYDRRDFAALSHAFDSPCEQKTHASYWMPHLAAAVTGDFERARQIETTVETWNRDFRQGKALVEHLRAVRLVAEGNAQEAAKRFAAVDGAIDYFNADIGVFKLYNRLQWSNALQLAGDDERAEKLFGEVAAVNKRMAGLYTTGEMVLPRKHGATTAGSGAGSV